MGKELSPHELAEILRVVTRVGVMMLQSGAASARTDQAMELMALGMGVDRIDAYATPTVIIVSVYSGNEHRTQITKPSALGVNMSRIADLMSLSRNMPTPASPDQITALLDKIQDTPAAYPPVVVVIAVGLACGAFAGILGAGLLEIIAATVGAASAQAVRLRLHRARYNPIATTVVCSAVATGISLLLVRLMNTPNPRLGVIASVLLLVPGVPLVTSILDATRFDLVSALSRGLFAALILLSIGIGMLLILAWSSLNIL